MDREASVPSGIPDRYRIEQLVGQGAFARVYRALDIETGKRVAIKVLTSGLRESPEALARFSREIAAYRRCEHPNIIAIHSAEVNEKIAFIVMDFIKGKNLSELLDERRFTLAETISIIAQVASALSTIHAAGLVHRDLKPANVILQDDGKVIVADFGLVRGKDFTTLTATGGVVGTPYYLAPEAIGGGTLTAESDLYTLGVITYELLTGAPPFEALELSDLLVEIRDKPFPHISKRDSKVPDELDALLIRTTLKDPTIRLPSASAFLERLSEVPVNSKLTAEIVKEALQNRPSLDLAPQVRANLSEVSVEFMTPKEALCKAKYKGEGVRVRKLKSTCHRVQRAKLLATNHIHDGLPNVFEVIECGTDTYIIYEDLAGISLARALLERRPLSETETLEIAHSLAETLATMHKKGIIHGDLRPANIIIQRGGRVRLDDLAISCSPERVKCDPFSAPEVKSKEDRTTRSDVYSFGRLVIDCLSLAPPFKSGLSQMARLGDIRSSLRSFIEKATAEEPSLRPKDGSILVDVLEDIIAAETDSLAIEPVSPDQSGESLPPLFRPALFIFIFLFLLVAGRLVFHLENIGQNSRPRTRAVAHDDKGVSSYSSAYKKFLVSPSMPVNKALLHPPKDIDEEEILRVVNLRLCDLLKIMERKFSAKELEDKLREFEPLFTFVLLYPLKSQDCIEAHRLTSSMLCLLESFKAREDECIKVQHERAMKKDTFLGKIIAVGKTFGGARPKFDGLMSRLLAIKSNSSIGELLRSYNDCCSSNGKKTYDAIEALTDDDNQSKEKLFLAHYLMALSLHNSARWGELSVELRKIWQLRVPWSTLNHSHCQSMHGLLRELECSLLNTLTKRGGQGNYEEVTDIVCQMTEYYRDTPYERITRQAVSQY